MKSKSLTILFLLSICFTFSFSQAEAKGDDKRKLEIFVESFEQENRVKDVAFELYKNGQEVVKTESKKGRFSFVITEGAGVYSVIAKKKGYLTKEIIFNTKNFPFEKGYEYQDLYLEFIPLKNKNEADYVFKGEMTYEAESRAYKVEKVDSSMINLKKNYEESQKRLDNIHGGAVENGDALAMLEEFEYAKKFYELAVQADPDDQYSRDAVVKMDSMIVLQKQKINEEREQVISALVSAGEDDEKGTAKEVSGEVTSTEKDIKKLPDSDFYSVQLGAFHDWFDEAAFADVPDMLVAEGSDYKRVLSGRFNDRDKAIERMNQLKESGFPDVFVVTMSGEERIGF